jgi:hypothetical protein
MKKTILFIITLFIIFGCKSTKTTNCDAYGKTCHLKKEVKHTK